MARLKDYVELIKNNKDCAVLKIKDGSELGLISLGYFNGNEKVFHLTKGKQRTCTVFYNDESSISWNCRDKSTLPVSDATQQKEKLIEDCLMMDFDINMIEKIEDTLYIKDYWSSEGKRQRFSLTYTDTNSFTTLHRNGVELTTFKNYEEAENYIYKILEDIDEEGFEFNETSAYVKCLSGIRKKVD